MNHAEGPGRSRPAIGLLPGFCVRAAYSLSIFILLELFSTWYFAVLAASLLIVLACPVLMAIERSPRYRALFVDRATRGGELRKQLLYVQLSFALLILVYWGLLGFDRHYVIAVAVMAWGFGDAAPLPAVEWR